MGAKVPRMQRGQGEEIRGSMVELPGLPGLVTTILTRQTEQM